MSCEVPYVTWGFGTEAARNLNVWICTATLTPIGLDKTHPKQVKCFYEKKHKNRSQTFILHQFLVMRKLDCLPHRPRENSIE